MTTSRPVFSWPSTCTTMRSRSALRTSVCCVSARPISHGAPACFSEVSGAAPVRRRSAMTQLTLTELKLFIRGRAAVGLLVSAGFPLLLMIIFGSIHFFNTPVSKYGGLTTLDVYVPILLVFAIGLLSLVLRLQRPGNRFATIAFSVVLLVVRAQPAWVVGLHRFIEVSVGILAGLLLSALWPEPQPNTVKN